MTYHDTKGSSDIHEADCIAYGRDGIELKPGGLWSLWDMYKVHGQNFFEAIVWLLKLKELGNLDADHLVSKPEFIIVFIDRLDAELQNLQLNWSRTHLERIRLLVKSLKGDEETKTTKKVFAQMFNSRVEELNSRIEDEIKSSVIYCLSTSQAAFALATEPVFGDVVNTRFPSAITDLNEARQSMAFGRWTAAVFHLMRALEVGVAELGVKVGATVKNQFDDFLPWGPMLSNIDSKIQPMPQSVERNELSHTRALLYHVNKAWRTDTMHPKATYTEEEATDAYQAAGSFMRHLAKMI